MTAKYQALEGGAWPIPLSGYSVRPDLWPIGSVMSVRHHTTGWLANWDGSEPRLNGPLAQYAPPGAAEALVLAGLTQRLSSCSRTHLVWDLVPGAVIPAWVGP